MLYSIQRFAAVLGMLLLLLTTASGQTPASNSPIDAKMRQTDERLNAPVTFSADRIYLGELLEALSAKTGVALSMDNNDNFSGILIACDLEQTPLADVMNSLWSLVSSKSGVWEWRADALHAPVRYSLRPTQEAHQEAGRLNKARQEVFEALSELTIRMSALSSEERKAGREKITADMSTDAPELSNIPLASQPATGNYWAGIRLFAALLPLEKRNQVLRGETITIPFSSLSEKDRQMAATLEEYGSHNYVDGILQDSHQLPDAIRFHTHSGSGDTYFVISLGWKNSFGGRTYFGTRTSAGLPHISADWMLPGDLSTLKADETPLTKQVLFKADTFWKKAPSLDQKIAQFAATADVSFLAVVPEGNLLPMPVSFDRTSILSFDEAWPGARNLMHKWRHPPSKLPGMVLRRRGTGPVWGCRAPANTAKAEGRPALAGRSGRNRHDPEFPPTDATVRGVSCLSAVGAIDFALHLLQTLSEIFERGGGAV